MQGNQLGKKGSAKSTHRGEKTVCFSLWAGTGKSAEISESSPKGGPPCRSSLGRRDTPSPQLETRTVLFPDLEVQDRSRGLLRNRKGVATPKRRRIGALPMTRHCRPTLKRPSREGRRFTAARRGGGVTCKVAGPRATERTG